MESFGIRDKELGEVSLSSKTVTEHNTQPDVLGQVALQVPWDSGDFRFTGVQQKESFRRFT